MFLEFANQVDCHQLIGVYFRDILKDREDEDGILIAKVSGNIVGTLFVRYGRGEAWIFEDFPKVISTPDFPTRKVQSALLKYVEDCCKHKGLPCIRIALSENKPSLVRLYAEGGFEKTIGLGMKRKIRKKDKVYASDLSFHSMTELGFKRFLQLAEMSFEGQIGFDAARTEEELKDFRSYEGYDPSMWLAAYKDNEPLGVIVPRVWEKGKWTKINTADILAIGVIPKHRRKGYGTNLLRKAIASLADKDVEEILLWVDSRNIPAINLYEKVGFRIWQRRYVKFLEKTQTYPIRFTD